MTEEQPFICYQAQLRRSIYQLEYNANLMNEKIERCKVLQTSMEKQQNLVDTLKEFCEMARMDRVPLEQDIKDSMTKLNNLIKELQEGIDENMAIAASFKKILSDYDDKLYIITDYLK